MERVFTQGPVIEVRSAKDLIRSDILIISGTIYDLDLIDSESNEYHFYNSDKERNLIFDSVEVETMINNGFISRMVPMRIKLNPSTSTSRCIE